MINNIILLQPILEETHKNILIVELEQAQNMRDADIRQNEITQIELAKALSNLPLKSIM